MNVWSKEHEFRVYVILFPIVAKYPDDFVYAEEKLVPVIDQQSP